MTSRFLDDLVLINHLIERNKSLDPFAISMASSGGHANNIEQLQESLGAAQAEIQIFLQTYRLHTESRRNRDPLSSAFIMGLFNNCWCDLMDGHSSRHTP
jgi:hypothetical protein